MTQESKYAAFISYRHVDPDRGWAIWLHRALEGYRTPSALVTGGVRRRVGRVFRDEEELAASSDLSAEIEQALDDSAYLIVVSSPRTPASQWVNAEIAHFQETGRGDRVLALLIEGQPFESFPPALRAIRPAAKSGELTEREVEPLAADVRPVAGESMRHRRRMALLRTVSPLLGCEFDQLRRREQQRRTRRMYAVAGFALALIGLLSGLVLWALAERTRANEAATEAARKQTEAEEARQFEAGARGDAEDLVNFMLFDLRDQLIPVGRLDILNSVAERAATYYANLPTRHESSRSAHRRAIGHSNVGDVLLSKGDAAKARAEYERAKGILAVLIEREPETLAWRIAQASTLYRLGDALRITGNVPEALEEFRAAAREAQAVAAAEPDNRKERQELLVTTHMRIADALDIQGQQAESLAAFERALGVALEASKTSDSDTWKNHVAVLHENVGDMKLASGDLVAAMKHYRASRVVTEALLEASPDDVARRHGMAYSHIKMGDVHRIQRRFGEARAEYTSARAILADLIALNPRNDQRKHELAAVYDRIGTSYEEEGKQAQAGDPFEEALKLTEALSAAHPNNLRMQHGLVLALTKVADSLDSGGETAKALAHLERAKEVARRLIAGDPSNLHWPASHATLFRRTGDILFDRGDIDEALKQYKRALQTDEALAKGRSSAEFSRALALSHQRVAKCYMKQKKAADALDAYRAAHDIMTQLAKTNAKAQHHVADSHIRIAHALIDSGDPKSGMKEADAAIGILRDLHEENAADRAIQSMLTRAYYARSEGLENAGDTEGAIAATKEAIANQAQLAPTNTRDATKLEELNERLRKLESKR